MLRIYAFQSDDDHKLMIVGICICVPCVIASCYFVSFFSCLPLRSICLHLKQRNSNVQEREHDFSTFEITKATLTQRDDAHKAMYTTHTHKWTHIEKESERERTRNRGKKSHEISLIFIYITHMHLHACNNNIMIITSTTPKSLNTSAPLHSTPFQVHRHLAPPAPKRYAIGFMQGAIFYPLKILIHAPRAFIFNLFDYFFSLCLRPTRRKMYMFLHCFERSEGKKSTTNM